METQIGMNIEEVVLSDHQFIKVYKNNVMIRLSIVILLLTHYDKVPGGDMSSICVQVMINYLEQTEDTMRIIQALMIKQAVSHI